MNTDCWFIGKILISTFYWTILLRHQLNCKTCFVVSSDWYIILFVLCQYVNYTIFNYDPWQFFFIN